MDGGIASPVSTGGGGSDFERRVGAYFLAAVLTGAVPRGHENGVATEVRFQRLYQNEPFDDVVIITNTSSGQAKLALQVKRDLVFGERNDTFNEVMDAAWRTFDSDGFQFGLDRFGIVLGLYSKTVDEHYQATLTWARTSATAEDFLTRISTPVLSHQKQREFVNLVRSTLQRCSGKTIADDVLWMFLRSMVILHFDLQQVSSRDYSHAVGGLYQVLPPDLQARAPQLFVQLVEYASECSRTAGSMDLKLLLQRLQADGFRLQTPPNCLLDLGKLEEHARFVLGDIRTDIGGQVLPRADLIVRAREAIREGAVLELVGPPGSGKSAIMKLLAHTRLGDGPPIVLAWDRLEGVGWSGFAQRLQLSSRLSDLVLVLSNAGTPVVFIDGVDRISDSGARKIINDLLRGIAATCSGQRQWSIVLTMREDNAQNVHTWIETRAWGKPVIIEVPQLRDDEFEFVASCNTALQRLGMERHLTPILRNPFFLSVLWESRINLSQTPLLSEADISEIWWRQVVGSVSPQGLEKQQLLLEFGRRDMASPGGRLSAQGMNAAALHSLETDRVLIRDQGHDRYRFRHDLLEDWVLARVLGEQEDDLVNILRDAGEPQGVYRALQLLACNVLEVRKDTAQWERLLSQMELASDLLPRWKQAVLTAPLASVQGQSLLESVEAILLKDDARRLEELLRTVRTVEVNPDMRILEIAQKISDKPEEIASLVMSRPIPRWRVWICLFGWLLPRVRHWPFHLRAEIVQLMETWMVVTPPRALFRREIGELAFEWLRDAERRPWDED